MNSMTRLLKFTKEAILGGGVSRYRISKDTGIGEASLSLFVNGKRSIGVDRVEVILDYLGYDIQVVKRESEAE